MMIVREWIIHFEWWLGKRWFPRLHIYRKPRHGDRVKDGGVMGTLIACQACSGVGLLHQADEFKLPEDMPFPMPSLYPESLPDDPENYYQQKRDW